MDNLPANPAALPDDVIVRAENVSKKFCRTLKRSMFYGMMDIGGSIAGIKPDTSKLRRDEFWAIRNVSFELKRGESVGLLGPNGSGKSSLLRVLGSILPPDEGIVTVRGRIGALIALGAGFHPHMTGRENIYLNGSMLGLSKEQIDERYDDIVNFSEIKSFLDAPLSTYSSGMRIRLGYAIAININPDLLVIDEILAVGDIGFRMKCLKHLSGIRDQGTSIILVSHSVKRVSRIAERIIVLDKGTKTYDGAIGEGLNIYEQLCEQEEETPSESKQVESRPSFLKEISLFNASGEPQTEFHAEQDIRVKMKFHFEKAPAPFRIIINVCSNLLGNIGSFSSDIKRHPFALDAGEFYVSFTIKNLSLLFGKYHLTVFLVESESGKTMERVEPAAEFEITSPEIDIQHGYSDTLYIDHEWE